jgi:hypothetical protein
MDSPMDKIHKSGSVVWLMMINNSRELDVDSDRWVRREARDTAEFRKPDPGDDVARAPGEGRTSPGQQTVTCRCLRRGFPPRVRALLHQVALRALQYVACRCGTSPSSWSGTARTRYG